METVATLRQTFVEKLQGVSSSPEFDVEIFFTHVLDLSAALLKAYPEAKISRSNLRILKRLLARRLQGEPVAYIVGHQPFWTLDLVVTEDTLIPRPETECLVEWVLQKLPAQDTQRVADLGVGSGAIALSLAKERALWQIDGVEKSEAALQVATTNRDHYHLDNVSFYQGEWCEALPKKGYDIIVSNPPYIAPQDPHLIDLKFEPVSALVAEEHGLKDISLIIQQSKSFLKEGGILVMEHGHEQAAQVIAELEGQGFSQIESHQDYSRISRFVSAVWGKHE